MIILKNVSKIYKTSKNNFEIGLDKINLTISNAGLVFIVGTSGSGKSTLLNLLSALDKPTSGEIIIHSKCLNNSKDKYLDYYRSNYVANIFQEFNLLEDFNVYSNIELSSHLNNTKVSKNLIDKVLNMVNLSGKGLRKINELSGGEKARVGIARALIKNPSIILADEPTGNLDTNSSEEVIKILKSISETKLVIVVTHDVNLALNYADRIIELKDGRILKDETYNNIEKEEEKVKLKKTRLSLTKSSILAFKNLKSKKIRLCITSILVTFSLSLFALAMSLTNYDVSSAHAKAMVNNNVTHVEILKTIDGKVYDTSRFLTDFTTSDLEEVKLVSDLNFSKAETLTSDNELPRITLNMLENDYMFYKVNLYDPNIIITHNTELEKLHIIGTMPKDEEILIHKLLADYIIYYGINIISENELGEKITTLYKPTSYEELINSKVDIPFGNLSVHISGIINDDLTKFEELKNITYEDEKKLKNNNVKEYNRISKLYEELINKSYEYLNYFIVSENFVNSINIVPNTAIDTERYKFLYEYNGTKYELNGIFSYYDGKEPINDFIQNTTYRHYYNGIELINIEDFKELKDNEIIIDTTMLDNLTNKKYSETYSRIMKEYRNLTTNYDIKNIGDIYKYTLMEINQEFGLIGSEITLYIGPFAGKENQSAHTLKIVGVGDNSFIYVNKNIVTDYIVPNEKINKLSIELDNKKDLENVFNTFNDKYITKTIYTESIKSVNKTIKKIKPIMFNASIIFLIFSIVLFMNYISSSINANKKKIGILRALGARKIDTFKIFYMESFIIGIISLISSSILELIFIKYANIYVSRNLFSQIEPIAFNINTIIYLIITVILVVFITSFISIYKLAKMNPIDAINNK